MSRTAVETSGIVPDASSASVTFAGGDGDVLQATAIERLPEEGRRAGVEDHALEIVAEPMARESVAQHRARERSV